MKDHDMEGLDSLRFQQKKLVAKRLENELLLFECESNTAHCLNEIAAEIWRACERQRTAIEITEVLHIRRPDLQEEIVFECLIRMADRGLLEEFHAENISLQRRELMRRARLVAAALLPIAMTSVIIPPAAEAASCAQLGEACSLTHPCCPGGVITLGCVGGVCIKL